MSYDHTNKPEGATHVVADVYGLTDDQQEANTRCCYRKNENGTWFAFKNSRWFEIDFPQTHRYRPIPAQWDGEGLPPVGTVCEINHKDLGWVRCEIVAHKNMDCGGKPHAIAWIDGNTLDQSQGIRFRPIRTPEQIAAEERANAITQLVGDMARGGSEADKVLAERLYQAGYRKQVAP